MSLNSGNNLKIAIDGPAGAGKSSVAKEIARRLGLKYLDTGSMYRAVTLQLIREKVSPEDLRQIEKVLDRINLDAGREQRIFLNGEDVTAAIRAPMVNSLVSPVSAIPQVRRRLVAMQREIAASSRGIVMDGRDIATRVMPDADFKFYLDAVLPERARRRREEQLAKGLDLSPEEVTAEIEERDRIDSRRADSPLTVAPGSIIIDTSKLTFEQVVQTVLDSITPDGAGVFKPGSGKV